MKGSRPARQDRADPDRVAAALQARARRVGEREADRALTELDTEHDLDPAERAAVRALGRQVATAVVAGPVDRLTDGPRSAALASLALGLFEVEAAE